MGSIWNKFGNGNCFLGSFDFLRPIIGLGTSQTMYDGDAHWFDFDFFPLLDALSDSTCTLDDLQKCIEQKDSNFHDFVCRYM